jgi:ribosomal protein S18 acetylase RimI-like enzyme
MASTSNRRETVSFRLRPGREDERRIRYRLVEQSWRAAYKHIYYTNEIDGVFDGRIPSYGDWVERRKSSSGHIVAESDGKMVGFVSLGLLKSGEGEVTALYVLPDYQGYGIGQALWDAACERLREMGCAAVWVWTLTRAAAVRFYERQGCVRADTGSYTVGEHAEKAVGFRLELNMEQENT